jgi:hypothetical protein
MLLLLNWIKTIHAESRNLDASDLALQPHRCPRPVASSTQINRMTVKVLISS